MSSLRKKTVFTPEQRASLEAAYSNGLVSTGVANSAAIGTLAEELQLDVSVIKVVSSLVPRPSSPIRRPGDEAR